MIEPTAEGGQVAKPGTKLEHLKDALDELIEQFGKESEKHKKLNRRLRYFLFALTGCATVLSATAVLWSPRRPVPAHVRGRRAHARRHGREPALAPRAPPRQRRPPSRLLRLARAGAPARSSRARPRERQEGERAELRRRGRCRRLRQGKEQDEPADRGGRRDREGPGRPGVARAERIRVPGQGRGASEA